jgi:hypothetical protein
VTVRAALRSPQSPRVTRLPVLTIATPKRRTCVMPGQPSYASRFPRPSLGPLASAPAIIASRLASSRTKLEGAINYTSTNLDANATEPATAQPQGTLTMRQRYCQNTKSTVVLNKFTVPPG